MTGLVAGWRASYTAGDWLVLGGPTALVALDPQTTLGGTEIEAIWNDVVGSSGMDELVARLSSVDRTIAPRLLVLFWTPDGMRTLVRGDLTLREVRSGNAIAQGDGVITWREVGLGEVTSAAVALPGSGSAGGQALPLVVGAVRAGSLRVDAAPGSAVHSPQVDAPAALDHVADDEDSEPAADAADDFDEAAGLGEEPTRRTELSSDDGPDDDTDDDTGDDTDPAGSRSDDAGEASEDADFVERQQLENADTALMAPPTPFPSAAAGLVGVASEAPPERPLVAAVSCPNGHLNPPYANGCWICGQPIGPQEPESVPRPVLARLQLPDGSSVLLDRPALIGRAPAVADGLPSEGETPRLLTVPSPGHDISRTHLLIAPDGWQILVTDLRSTNGTTVVAPGPGVERTDLQPMQPLSVAIGTLVELGDGVALLIDGAE